MKLRFGGKRLAGPARVGGGLGVGDVHGGIQRQLDLGKHPAIKPATVPPGPKVRGRPAFPQESEILTVCNFVLAEAEAWNIYLVLIELVVPAERTALLSQRGYAGRDIYHRIR